MTQQPVPAIVPYIVVKDAAAALAFYEAAFGAEELFRLTDPADGRIGHAEIAIGGAVLMLADEYPDLGVVSPGSLGGTTATLHLTVEDTDAAVARARAAGAAVQREPQDQSFGERIAVLLDPFGHRWMIAQKIEEVGPAEMQRRWEAEAEG